MDIVLLRNNSLPNVVNKSLTLVTSHSNAKFLDPYDEYMPVIRVKGKTNWDDVNYIKVESTGTGNDQFARYYFIEGVTIKSPQIAVVQCRLDVLQTYSTFIGLLQCYVTRTGMNDVLGTNTDKYLVDSRPEEVFRTIEKKTFRDANDKVVGFLDPTESQVLQEEKGLYVISVIHDCYDTHS